MRSSPKQLFSNHRHNEQGFTLIEVLVALSIFAIGLLALAGMQITGIQGNSRAQSLSAKVALADGVIEEFLAMDGADTRLTTEVTDSPWASATDIQIDGAGTCSATVSIDSDPVIGADTYTGLTQVEVTVTNNVAPAITKTIMKRRY